jgi:hypothetical protein
MNDWQPGGFERILAILIWILALVVCVLWVGSWIRRAS